MKNKENLVLTMSIGDYYQKLSELTLPSIMRYAKSIDADFLNITESNPEFATQKWNKFNIYELLNKYNRILYLDIDVIVREDCPNLFDLVPNTKLGMFDEGKYIQRLETMKQAAILYEDPLKKWNSKYYNTSVMVVSRIHKKLFKLPNGCNTVDDEKPYINLRISNDKVEMFDLEPRYNRMSILDEHIGINRLGSYIVHYSGAPQEMIFPILQGDIQKWKEAHPNYDYKRNIVISVSAGMGDQLCSEPAVRYTKKIYPDANIYVVTHHPRLFEHLNKEMTITDYEKWKGINDAIIKFYTCPDDETSEHKLSHVLFHPTDFASMSMIKRTIPNKDKTIKLKVEANDVMSVMDMLKEKPAKKMILVHPGKWWPSKSFPIEWWQEVVDKLSEKLCVCLIGKRMDDKQGYIPVVCPEDGYDFRDITSLGEMIALISISKVTLTNDSSPIHIAGAFDNWIVAIPTCKHPDHIFPFRNSRQDYKTKAIYKKLLLDDLEIRHTEFYTNTIDTIPEGKTLYDYLPDPDEVVKEVFDIYEKDGDFKMFEKKEVKPEVIVEVKKEEVKKEEVKPINKKKSLKDRIIDFLKSLFK